MIVGTLGFLWALLLPASIIINAVRPRPKTAADCICGGMPGAAKSYTISADCPVHQIRFDYITDWQLNHPTFTIIAVIGFIFGCAIGGATLGCGPYADSWGQCYGGVPWP